jgi:CelD/BcsL family acetyltransferase involved in cellulose biosynthesis
MNAIIRIDPTEDPSWARFVAEHPDGSIFHHPAWLRLLRDQYEFDAFALCVVRDGAICAGVPFFELGSLLGRRRWVCLPFSDRCGLLSSSRNDAAALLEALMSEAKKAHATVEIRDTIEPGYGLHPLASHWLHVTRLDGTPADMLRRLDADVRRRIRKALRAGLETEIRHDPQSLEIFYRLHLLTRRKQGVPIQPRRYFALFQRHIIDSGMGFVALTRHGAQYLSAAVFCTSGETATYKYGASDPEALELSPNYLMFWEAMRHARDGGHRRFDFGKTSTSNPGLRFFKNKWNTEETELSYCYAPAPPAPGALDLVRRRLVSPVIQHSPQFVCRVAGELLYKRFGA